MARTYSQLVYRQIEPREQRDGPPQTVIALHGNNGGLGDLIPLASELGPELRIIAPEAARGVYLGIFVQSRTWFGGTCDRPEPASFGDSLSQIERFLYDVRERDNAAGTSRPWLLGFDQGAVLALSIATIAPDLISGVIAICGGLPTFADPALLEPMDVATRPILLVEEAEGRPVREPCAEATRSRLKQIGHDVELHWITQASNLGPAVRDELQRWTAVQRGL